jgi:glutaminase
VSKVVNLLFALESYGEDVFSRIGVEQTADAFNSIIKLETRNQGKPLNPLINAGAIATIAYIAEHEGKGTFRKLVAFLRKMARNPHIHVNQDVYQSEKRTGDINRALAYFQKGTNAFSASVDVVLDTYFQMCSLEVTVQDLARIAQVIANNGLLAETGERVFSDKTARMTKAIMMTCGMYDSSGHFTVTVGLPSKSGVGGGILSVVPGRYGIGTMAPALDEKGNSAAGVELLTRLSEEMGLSIFQ